MNGRQYLVTIREISEEEWWQDGYDTGHAHGAAGLPNMLDVRGRTVADVIPIRDYGERDYREVVQ